MDLTAQNDSVNHSDRQAGADDIEITPEMIKAGAEELNGFVAQDLADGFITRWEVAEAVHRAMLRVARSKTLKRRDIF
jgi:hypothetical protein